MTRKRKPELQPSQIAPPLLECSECYKTFLPNDTEENRAEFLQHVRMDHSNANLRVVHAKKRAAP